MSTPTPRQATLQALRSVFEQGGYSNLVLESAFSGLSPRDRAFAAALFYGVLERAVTLDWVISRFSKRPPEKLSPTVLQILRIALYQLLYMPSIPESAAVNEAVTLTRKNGCSSASGFVNGVLRAFLRAEKRYDLPKDKMTALAVQTGVPKELIIPLRRAYGHERTVAFLQRTTRPTDTFVRVNTLRTTPEKLSELLAAEGITASPVAGFAGALRIAGGTPMKTASYKQGLFHIQDLASQRTAAALGAAPGMRLLDLCAAPGGKSFTAAQLMEDGGTVLSCDLHPHRTALIEEGAARLGLRSITARTADAAVHDPSLGLFDRVLCDVPCSGYGVIARKPEIRYKHPADQRELPELQYRILENAASYLAPGGRLVYSTCTLLPEENAQQIERFLAAHPDFEPDGEMTTLLPGVDGWEGDGFFFSPLRRRG